MGGSAGWADPDAELAFGYVMNRMDLGLAGDQRSYRLDQRLLRRDRLTAPRTRLLYARLSPDGIRARSVTMAELWNDLKKFIMQGDLVAIAVAFILGLAFKAVVDSIVNDLIMPAIGIIFGETSFAALTVTINGAIIRYGAFLTVLLNFLIIGVTLFVVVKVYERLEEPAEPRGEGRRPE